MNLQASADISLTKGKDCNMLHLIPNTQEITRILELSERYGAAFEYNEFAMPAVLCDEERTAELISFYKAIERDRSQDTMHGAFLDITIHSDDPDIRRISQKRIYQCMDIADKLGIRGVVFHTNTIPNFRSQFYLDNWLKRNEEFYREVTAKYPYIEIFIENMFDESPEDLAGLAEHMKDVANFGVCFDYAHANIFGHNISLKTWVHTLLPYTRHIHINDNDGFNDQHAAIGQGSINWQEYKCLVGGYERTHKSDDTKTDLTGDSDICFTEHGRISSLERKYTKTAPSVLIETNSPDNFESSCIYMSKHGIYPFT